MKKQKKALIIWAVITVTLVIVAVFSVIKVYDSKENLSGHITAGWGDSEGGRPSYTIDEINKGILGDKIVFNSISNGSIGDEKNFVGARSVVDIAKNPDGYFKGNEITVEDGEEYLIRLYVHNNSLGGKDSMAENVRVAFSVPWGIAKNIPINGFIFSDNATPDIYWDGVVLTADRNFHLEYVEGSAEFGNNGFAAEPKPLSDEVVSSPEGVLIGYKGYDGEIPGCFEYACVVTIRVKAILENDFLIENKVRLDGEKEWAYNVEANIGDKVEFQIQYKNLDISGERQEDVMIRDILPEGLRYVPNTIKFYNANHQDGLAASDDNLFTKGINIGTYGKNANAYIRFTAEVVDESLEPGQNTLVNWGKGTANNKALTDYATVTVYKAE